MKHLLALMALCVAFATWAQVSNDAYDPDADGDNNIGVNDLLALLSLFGENDVDDDGIWDSGDDCLADSCQFKAYLIVEPDVSSTSVAQYIFDNFYFDPEVPYEYTTGDWFGLGGSGGFPNSEVFQVYADYIESHIDSTIFVFESTVPQVNGGFDAAGKPKLQFTPETIWIPQLDLGDAWFWLFISEEAMGGLDTGFLIESFDLSPTTSFCFSPGLSPEWSSIDIVNPGGIFPSGTYHLYSTFPSQFMSRNTDTPYYVGGYILD